MLPFVSGKGAQKTTVARLPVLKPFLRGDYTGENGIRGDTTGGPDETGYRYVSSQMMPGP